MKIKRAIVSVSDKTGLIPLVKELRKHGVEIFSTGGTLVLLKKNKLAAQSISELTGFPEILDGRVKTLHPKVHGGLLFLRSDKAHLREAKAHGIKPIDMVIVNLYPFTETIQKPSVTLKSAVEQIDVGGPSMLRSSAKNFESVTVVCDPADYPKIIEDLKTHKGSVSTELRRLLAVKVFRHTAAYDREISKYLSKQLPLTPTLSPSRREGRVRGGVNKGALPEIFEEVFRRSEPLRYGENPHQRAAIYKPLNDKNGFCFKQFQGKELSYNNILDFEAAVDVLSEFNKPAACVVKHNNPCGIASGEKITEAVSLAVDCDPLSAFGGIVAINQSCSLDVASVVLQKLSFFEVLIAPHYTKEALEVLKSRKNLRVLEISGFDHVEPYDFRFMKSSLLVQDHDPSIINDEKKLKKNLKWVTKEKIKNSEIDDLIFAWKCAKVVRSNAIVLTRGKQTVGIGCGQMSRVDSVRLACMKAQDRTKGTFLASDGFFPMPDNIEVAYEYGIRAIIQPGGSIRDQDVINACDQVGIAMAFTGKRHFKH